MFRNIMFSDVTLSDINVVGCYVLSQYHENIVMTCADSSISYLFYVLLCVGRAKLPHARS
jgi:hypothetical protein